MINLIIFIFACIGITNIIVKESIFSTVRNFIESYYGEDHFLTYLINCTTCIGTWIGLILTLLVPELIDINIVWYYKALLGAGMGAFINKTYTTLLFNIN